MGLPFNYNQITINQLQTIQPFLENEKDWTKIIGYFLNKTDDEVEAFSLRYYKYCVRKLSFLKELPKAKVKLNKQNFLIKKVSYYPKKRNLIYFKGHLFKAYKDVNDINTGDYISIKTVISENKEIDCLHTLCAIVYKRAFGKDFSFIYKEELFKYITVQKAYNTLFFCLEVLMNWSLNTLDYLEAVEKIQKNSQEMSLQNFGTIGDGIV